MLIILIKIKNVSVKNPRVILAGSKKIINLKGISGCYIQSEKFPAWNAVIENTART